MCFIPGGGHRVSRTQLCQRWVSRVCYHRPQQGPLESRPNTRLGAELAVAPVTPGSTQPHLVLTGGIPAGDHPLYGTG